MSQNDQDEQLLEDATDTQDVAEGLEDNKPSTSLHEEASTNPMNIFVINCDAYFVRSQTQSKPRRYHLFKKMAVAAVQHAGEEWLASWLANDRNKYSGFFTSRIPKKAVYGSLVHIPLTSGLFKVARYLFRARTSYTFLLAIFFDLFVIAPIQKIIDITAGAIIAGARTMYQVRATIRVGFLPVMKVLLLVYPIAAAFASNFLVEKAWPKFFFIVNLAINTYSNAFVKYKRLQALRRRYFNDKKHNLDGNKVESDGDADESGGDGDESDGDSIAVLAPIEPSFPPSPPGYSALGQRENPLSASQSFHPAPLRRHRVPIYTGDSDAGKEWGNSAEEQGDTDSDEILTRMVSYYRQNDFSDSDAEGDGSRPHISLPMAAATTTEPIERELDNVNSWSTVESLDDSINSEEEEEEEEEEGEEGVFASDIDSDTSSDLPWNRTYGRRRRFGVEMRDGLGYTFGSSSL